jgi:hypothetical protein
MMVTESQCKCPTEKKCRCDEPTILAKFAVNKSINMVLTALIGGFAFAISLLFSTPIQQAIQNVGFTEMMSAVFTGLIFFGIAVVLVIILIFVGRANNNIKVIAKLNNYVLE